MVRAAPAPSRPTEFPIKTPTTPRRFLPLTRRSLAAACLVASVAGAGAMPAPDQVVGPAACAECHPQEVEAWKATKHFKSFFLSHRTAEAEKMISLLGLQPMKSEPRCTACHYLEKATPEASQTAAISCESCHGAGREWVKTHGDYGPGVKKEHEPAEHRTARFADAVAHGMIRPGDLYALGRNCYGCHVLQDEKLANVGGHVPGSAGFNLVAWTQGEVRHNVLHTDNRSNPEAPLEVRRRMLVVGWILETEFCFRATAQATEKAAFGVTFARRADAARKMLEKIQGLAPTPELAAIIAVAQPVALKLNNAAQLTAAADRVGALGRDFSAQVPAEKLAGLDSLLPGTDAYQGTPFVVSTQP